MIGDGKFKPLSKRVAVWLASLSFVLCISHAAASPSGESPAGDIPAWVETIAQAGGFGRSGFAELDAYKKVSAKRKLQAEFLPEDGRSSGASNKRRTELKEQDKERLVDAMETIIDGLPDGAGAIESIFEFENHCSFPASSAATIAAA